jgi:hypothetical protein
MPTAGVAIFKIMFFQPFKTLSQQTNKLCSRQSVSDRHRPHRGVASRQDETFYTRVADLRIKFTVTCRDERHKLMIDFTFNGWFDCGRELSAESVALFEQHKKFENNNATRQSGEDQSSIEIERGWEGGREERIRDSPLLHEALRLLVFVSLTRERCEKEEGGKRQDK